MIVERRSFSPAQVPLPEAVRSALAAISSDLRDIPRDAVLDRMELLHWLRRMARRVDGAAAMTTPTTGKSPVVGRPRHRIAGAGRPASPREIAEAVFGKRPPAPRTITTRKGRSVRVETRRSLIGQFEMEF